MRPGMAVESEKDIASVSAGPSRVAGKLDAGLYLQMGAPDIVHIEQHTSQGAYVSQGKRLRAS